MTPEQVKTDWTIIKTLEFIVELEFIQLCPNIVLSPTLFLTFCVSVASCERSFSKLCIIKDYLRSTMGQERLSGLAILSIKSEFARIIDFDDIINDFAVLEARKVAL